MLLNLTNLSDKPIHSQIAVQILEKILTYDDYDGDRLPDIRKLASEQHVSAHAIERAYKTLMHDGLIIPQNGGHFFVPVFSADEKQFLRRRLSKTKSKPNFDELEQELNSARQIQMHLLPQSRYEDESLSVATHYESSKAVGGDFFDYIQLPEDKLGVVIADACGNGLPAALLISQVHAMIRSEIRTGNSIKKSIDRINRQIMEYTPRDKFITLVYGILDKKSLEFEYVTAGHNYPILIGNDGCHQLLRVGGPGLGLLQNTGYVARKLSMKTSDILCLYTDGITELMNDRGEEYGERRLLDLLKRERSLEPQGIIDAFLDDLVTFHRNGTGQDDQTMLLMKIK